VTAAKRGYKNLLVYLEGMPVWEEFDYPRIKGPEYEERVETVKMPILDLVALIKSNEKDFVIVDVRDEQEYAEGHIPGAINIPVATFASKSSILDKKKRIIAYCNGGGRSNKAYRKLMKLGYKKRYQVFFTDWKDAGQKIENNLLFRRVSNE
jgi:rhodanese-related sulfurtransferase